MNWNDETCTKVIILSFSRSVFLNCLIITSSSSFHFYYSIFYLVQHIAWRENFGCKILGSRVNGKLRLDVLVLWLVHFPNGFFFSWTFSSCTSYRAIPPTFLQLYAMIKEKKREGKRMRLLSKLHGDYCTEHDVADPAKNLTGTGPTAYISTSLLYTFSKDWTNII